MRGGRIFYQDGCDEARRESLLEALQATVVNSVHRRDENADSMVHAFGHHLRRMLRQRAEREARSISSLARLLLLEAITDSDQEQVRA